MKGTPPDRFRVSLGCAPGGRLNEIVRKAGMRVHEIRSLVQPLHPPKDLSALFSIARLLRREKIDILHTHNSKTGFLGRLAGKIAGTPVVIHTVHGFAFHDSEAKLSRAFYKRLERIAAPWADHTIFISQPLIDWARRERILQEGRYSRIYSGIDLDAFHHSTEDEGRLRSRLGLGEEDRVIGFVAKLWEGKGHETALSAMVSVVREVPRARLLLVGEGKLESKLRSLCERLGLQRNVIFAGFQNRIAGITSLCELCILPSFFEGMGRVLLEAGACGKPVVASRVGGIPDVVVDGETGILVPPGDARALAFGILRLLSDPDSARSMGRRAKRRINDEFDAKTMVRRIVSVYDACLIGKGIVRKNQDASERILDPELSDRKAG